MEAKVMKRIKNEKGAVITVETLVWVAVVCIVLVFVGPKLNTSVQGLFAKSDAKIESLDTVITD